ncbi:MAG: YjbQ family protein [Anaerolineaceae bacterium]|nr:YjbQ family protein [Anaerolineaceae bacterium]
MEWLSETLTFTTSGKGMYIITSDISEVIMRWKIQSGMCFLFLPHTSASLTLSENYDPRSRKDVEKYYEHAVPENQPWYQHTFEGPDDSPSHIRSTLTQSSISIPVDHGQLSLGTWQGIFLFEHRAHPQRRKLSIRCLKVT